MFAWAIRRPQQRRLGATAVEFAFCAPVLFLFTFASLEFARVNSIRQSVENAVYEGCRRGIVPGATAEDVTASTQAVLDAILTHNASITVTPTEITDETTSVSVAVSVPMNFNSWVIPFFFADRNITSSMEMVRERALNRSVE